VSPGALETKSRMDDVPAGALTISPVVAALCVRQTGVPGGTAEGLGDSALGRGICAELM
jgi:hypothetical protein